MKQIPSLEKEFRGLELGDQRRVKRVVALANALADHPARSFPKCGDESVREAIYRLLNNERIAAAALSEGHFEQTRRRVRERGLALAIHDTTHFCFGGLSAREGLGKVEGGQGFYGHFCLAVSAGGDEEPLGVLACDTWVRQGKKGKRSTEQRLQETGLESERWLAQSLAVQEALPDTPLIHVEDREGDIYASLAERLRRGLRFIVRGRSFRMMDDGEKRLKVLEHLLGAPVLLRREVVLSKRAKPQGSPRKNTHRARALRPARLEVSAARIQLRRPQRLGEEYPPLLELTAALVREVSAPEGEEPVQWLLLTSEPASNAAEAALIVDSYRARWRIEEYFKALKTGCGYEARQLESYAALRRALGLFTVLAWRILWIRHWERQAPSAPASCFLSADEIKVLHLKCKIGDTPTVAEALRAIARLGGHIKNNGPPGWRILWDGLSLLQTLAEGFALAKRCDQ